MDDEKDRKLKTAIENVKYLEAQITPLAESNAKLKECIQGLQFYMEQRRQDFASLLSVQNSQLKINLGDMVNIYEWLQKDIHNYLTKIRTLETENEMFKIFIKESDDDQRQQRASFLEIIENQTTTIETLNQQLLQQQEQFRSEKEVQLKEYQGEILKLEQKLENTIQGKQKEYDSLKTQYQQLDEEYVQKVKKLKQELTSQYDRQERATQVEFQKQIKELNDQITKSDIKNRQCLSELQNLKQDYQQLAQKYGQQQKANNKLTRQVENLVATIKSSREEIDQLTVKNEELQRLVDQLRLQISIQTKQESELHQYIKLQKQQYTELEENTSKQVQEYNTQIAVLQNQVKKNELCIKELSDMNVKMEAKCREQLTKQRIKYEQILYPHRVSASEMLYKDSQMQHDDTDMKDLIEDYELMLSQYYKEKLDAVACLQESEESFKLQISTTKKSYEQQIQQMQKDFDIRFKNEQKQSKQVIKELHRLKVNELEQLAKNHQLEIKEIHYQYKNQSSNQTFEMERMKSKLTENEKVIDQLNELIIQLQDNAIELKASHEQQLELLRRNHQIGKEQLAMAFEERSGSMINEIQNLKLKQEDYENQKINDSKTIQEQKRKIEQCQQTIQQLKDEGRQYSLLVNEKCLLIEQLQVQLGRQNEIVKQLQCEADNSRQVYNIFRNTSMSLKQPEDQLLKTTDFKKTNNSLKYSRTKQTRQIVHRPLIQNTTMQIVNIDSQLPKVRSISNNQIRTTPRHHSSQM